MLDAFDQIFDEAELSHEPMDDVPRRKKGRAIRANKTGLSLPAPTVSEKPAKAGKKKASQKIKPTDVALSSSTIPADEAGEKTVKNAPNAKLAAPSSQTIAPKKRGRPAMAYLKANTSTPDATNSKIARRIARESQIPLASKDDGQVANGNHSSCAVVHPISDGQTSREIPIANAIGERDDAGQIRCGGHLAHASVVATIQAQWRMRQRWHKAEKSLILQSKAICRGFTDGDKTEANAMFDSAWKAFNGKAEIDTVNHMAMIALAPFLPAIKRFEQDRAQIEKSIVKMSKTLPAYEWATSQRGIDKGFAWIVGEAGDIGSYKSVSALWKRMGLAVFDGERQRKKANAEEALLHGYSPSRRSVMWNVGGSLIGAMGRGPRPSPDEDITDRDDWSIWQKLFVERCRYECARDPEKMPLKIVEKGDEQRESYPKHAQARAKRYVEKRFLRKLYAQWRLETLGEVEPEFVPLPLAAE